MKFAVNLIPAEPDEDGYSIVVPALPGCMSQGNTKKEALSNIEEAIELYIDSFNEVKIDDNAIVEHVVL